MLNSLSLLAPTPLPQTQSIPPNRRNFSFILTPPPQKKKKLFNKESMEEIIPDRALKKESA